MIGDRQSSKPRERKKKCVQFSIWRKEKVHYYGKEYENDPRGMYDLSDPADVARMEADKKRPLADLKKREVPEYSVVDKGLLSLVGAGKWLYDRGAEGIRAADGAVRSRSNALSRWWRGDAAKEQSRR